MRQRSVAKLQRGAKAAAGRLLAQRRHHAGDFGEPPALVLQRGAEARHRRHQAARIGVQRRREQRVDRRGFHIAPGIHHDHALRGFRDHAEIMGDQDDRGAKLGLELPDQVQDLRLDGDVERRGRLVGDQHLRIAGQRHGDHDALAHPAGELMRVLADAPLRFRNAHQREHLDGARERRAARQILVQHQDFADLVADGQHGIERGHRLLEDHRDLIAAQRAHLAVRQVEQVAPLEADRATDDASGGRLDQPQHRQRGDALAAARTLRPRPASRRRAAKTTRRRPRARRHRG